MNYKYLVLGFVLLAVIVYQFSLFKSLTDDYNELGDDYIEYKNEKEQLIGEMRHNITILEQEKDALIANLKNLESDFIDLSESHLELKEEVDQTVARIEDYKLELEQSMAWFRDNSIIDGVPNENRITRELDSRCWESTDDGCDVKLGCFYLVNYKKLNYRYKYDTDTSGEKDQLQSLYDFSHNWGGDCEDYSLFYKAEYNHILGECGDKEIILESWQQASSDDRHFLDLQEEWYLQEATGIILKEGYIYPNIICGNIYDINIDKVAGHCVIAFTEKKIENKDDLKELSSAPVVEPQNGMYLGMIDDVSSGIYLLNEGMTDLPDSYIYEVITDSDLFLFSVKHNEWLGYSVFSEELDETKEELIGLLD